MHLATALNHKLNEVVDCERGKESTGACSRTCQESDFLPLYRHSLLRNERNVPIPGAAIFLKTRDISMHRTVTTVCSPLNKQLPYVSCLSFGSCSKLLLQRNSKKLYTFSVRYVSQSRYRVSNQRTVTKYIHDFPFFTFIQSNSVITISV